MKVIHTSPVEITEIHNDGLFGDCLCFSHNEYAMGAVQAVYEIELDKSKIIDANCLELDGIHEQEAISEILRCYDFFTENEAFDLLCDKKYVNSKIVENIGGDSFAEVGWHIQRLQGMIASKDGFDAFKSTDEQGTVFIVPMSGKLSRLNRVR